MPCSIGANTSDLGEEVPDIREPGLWLTDGWEMTAELMLTEEGNIGNSFSPVPRLMDFSNHVNLSRRVESAHHKLKIPEFGIRAVGVPKFQYTGGYGCLREGLANLYAKFSKTLTAKATRCTLTVKASLYSLIPP
jgi:hypothetical protein